MKFHINLGVTILIFLLVLSGGAFLYHQVEGWRLLDSSYFVVMTVTTIGYGDFAPKTDTGKVFTIFYSFFGVAFALYLLSLISSNVFKKHLSSHVGKIKKQIQKQEEIKEDIQETKGKRKKG